MPENITSKTQSSHTRASPLWSRLQSLIAAHPQATFILIAFIILAVVYSLATPPLEAGDESRHYAVVKYMADTGRLPVQEPGEAQIHWSHEGNQPPLYYALAAALTFWIDTGAWDDVFWYNPHTSIGNPLRPDNKNITIHPPGSEWPWRGYVLAVHLSRFLSIAMAGVTVITGYAIGLSLFRGDRWLAAGAMAITAFNPMFIFISSAVNNDNAVIMFVTLALWLMLRMANGEWRMANSKSHSPPIRSFAHSPFAIRYPLSAICYPLSAIRYPLSAIRYLLSAICYPPLLLGLLIGLGALSKLYALGLLPLAGLLFLWLAYQNNRELGAGNQPAAAGRRTLRFTLYVLRSAFYPSLMLLVVVILVAGWFYLRNALLYEGDVLALQAMRETAGQRRHMPSLATLQAEFEGFRIAYWALFGGVNILADPWIYRLLDWVSLAALIGVVAFLIRFTTTVPGAKRSGIYDFRFTIYPLRFMLPASKPNPPLTRTTHYAPRVSMPTFFLLLTWYAIMIIGFIVWNLTQPAGQGRLLYPAIAAISALGLLGLVWWLPPPWQKVVAAGCTLSLLVFAAIAPLRYIAPAYAKPPLLTEQDLPPDVQPLNFSYDGKMHLLGYQLPSQTIRPAENLPLILYWQMLAPTRLDYSLFVHVLGRQRQVVGQVDTYPGGGHWPTSLLAPGVIIADHYAIPIAPAAETEHAPTRLLLLAGIYDYRQPGRPGQPATNAAGQPIEPVIASLKLIPWQWPNPPRLDPPIEFTNQITLLSYQVAPDHSTVTLNWQANADLDTDYTVFLQLWGDTTTGAAQVRGFDSPPVQNDYPTSLWAAGEIIVDTHRLDLTGLPAADYELLAGLYNPTTGDRLPALVAGQPLPDYAVNLGQLQVTP